MEFVDSLVAVEPLFIKNAGGGGGGGGGDVVLLEFKVADGKLGAALEFK